jgi:hypothetical protein
MKKRIIITEKQYKEIFLNNSNYYNILKENVGDELIKLLRKNFDKNTTLKKISDDLTGLRSLHPTQGVLDQIQSKIQTFERIIGDDNLDIFKRVLGVNKIEDPNSLFKAIRNKNNFTKEDLSALYNIDIDILENTSFREILIQSLKQDVNIEKLFITYKSLIGRVDKTNPSRITVEKIINDHIPIEIRQTLENDRNFAYDVGKSLTTTNLPSNISKFNLNGLLDNIPDRLNELESFMTKMVEEKKTLDEFFLSGKIGINKDDLIKWRIFSENLTPEEIKNIGESLDELKTLINKNGINPKTFYTKLESIIPGPWKQFIINVANKIGLGGKRTFILMIVYYIGITLLGGVGTLTLYNVPAFLKKLMSDKKTSTKNDSVKKISDKVSYENSPKGFNEFLIKNPGFKLYDTDIIKGEKDIFTISTSDNEEYVSFNYKDGTFIEVPEQE